MRISFHYGRPPETPHGRERSSRRARLACALLCMGTVLAASPQNRAKPLAYSAYFDQVPIALAISPAQRGQNPFAFGPWRLGGRVRDRRPTYHRPNFYLVLPGLQHRLDGQENWNHNAVLSSKPLDTGTAEWDVYWVFVLDPTSDGDLRSERDLLIAGETGFRPGDLFEFDDMPAARFLRQFLGAESMLDLARFRRQDGRLPRVIIVPAGWAVRAAKG